MDASKKIVQARVTMLFDHPFYGYLAMGLELQEKPEMKVKTMGTDGRHLFYDPGFVADTSLPELMGVIAHELAHCFLNHIGREGTRVHERWNVACDYAVNDLVLKEFPLPKGILHDPQYVDMNAEAIYNRLPADKNGGGGKGTLDSHEDWGKLDGGGDSDGDTQGGIEQQWREAVAQAANQARARGNLPTHLAEAVGELLQPKLDWRAYLTDYIVSQARNDYRFMPANKHHIYRGIYLPSLTGQEINIGAAIDTSGSTWGERGIFLSELWGICQAYADYTIHLMTNDAQVHQKWELHAMDPIPNILAGGGGTDFRPVFEEMDKLDGITSVVFFTDLDGRFPDKAPTGYGVIWVATSDLRAPFGTVIRYPMTK